MVHSYNVVSGLLPLNQLRYLPQRVIASIGYGPRSSKAVSELSGLIVFSVISISHQKSTWLIQKVTISARR
jgi:hypothetical protein